MNNPLKTRSIIIAMTDKVFAALIAKARSMGMTPTLYGKLLFEAAWAARCGKAEDDPILIDCVAQSFGRKPSAAPAAPAAPAPAIPTRVLEVVPVLVPVPVPIPLPVEIERRPVIEPAAPAVARSEPAAVPVAPPSPPTAEESSALIRTVKGYAAAGLSVAEIARQTGSKIGLVKQIVGRA